MFDELVRFIRDRFVQEGAVPLHAPVLGEADRQGVLEAIDCGFVSSVGPHVPRFEAELAKATGAAKAVAVVNGTAALHLAMIVSGVKPGDVVLTQALTFVATANAISYIGAKPAFVDSEFDTLGMSPTSLHDFLCTNAVRRTDGTFLKSGERVAACVPMHVFGHPVRIDEILAVCAEWKIPVIEDAAESLGSEVDGRPTGTIAPVGVLSFNGNKIITTGGGGALLFRDETMAARARHLATTAKQPHDWSFYHDEVGFNYRLPNLNAALGCAQLARLEEFLRVKRRLAGEYEAFFKSFRDVTFISAREGTNPNFWLNSVLLRDRQTRDEWLTDLNQAGIQARPVWELMTELPMYRDCYRNDLSVARDVAQRLVNLPSGVNA